jgi:hypothetical protein
MAIIRVRGGNEFPMPCSRQQKGGGSSDHG